MLIKHAIAEISQTFGPKATFKVRNGLVSGKLMFLAWSKTF